MQELHGMSSPQPVQGQNAKLTRFSMLQNFPVYMKSNIWENEYTFLEDNFINQKGDLLSGLMFVMLCHTSKIYTIAHCKHISYYPTASLTFDIITESNLRMGC